VYPTQQADQEVEEQAGRCSDCVAYADHETGSDDDEPDPGIREDWRRFGCQLSALWDVRGKHFGRWSPWYALHMVLRPDLQRLKDEGMPLLSELNAESDVILRCFRTGEVTHAGDRKVMFRFSNYLIDVHKRKDNMRGKQGKDTVPPLQFRLQRWGPFLPLFGRLQWW
jgi:hypothetical protein